MLLTKKKKNITSQCYHDKNNTVKTTLTDQRPKDWSHVKAVVLWSVPAIPESHIESTSLDERDFRMEISFFVSCSCKSTSKLWKWEGAAPLAGVGRREEHGGERGGEPRRPQVLAVFRSETQVVAEGRPRGR